MKNPYLSISNFIDYAISASPAKRASIIEQYHQPQVYKFDWHGASDKVFYLRAIGSAQADTLIDQEKLRQRALLTGQKFKDRVPNHILEMMELFETSDIAKTVEECEVHPANEISPDLILNGLTIRVAPALILKRRKLGSKEYEQGFMKGYFCKPALSEESAALYCLMLQLHAEQVFSEQATAASLCKAYDLYGDASYTAPKSQKRRRDLLQAAAQEVVDRWETVGERAVEKHEKAAKKGRRSA